MIEVLVGIARCTISGFVHGYVFEGELVQTADGRLVRRRRNEFGPPLDDLAFEAVEPPVDLRAELDRLRSAPPLVRPDRRFARLVVRVGSDAIELVYPRPFDGDVQTDHPADRLYAALWDWPAPR